MGRSWTRWTIMQQELRNANEIKTTGDGTMMTPAGAVSLPRGEQSRNSLQASQLGSRLGHRGHAGVLLVGPLALQDAPGWANVRVSSTLPVVILESAP